MDHAIALAIVLLPLATFALATCQGQWRMPGWSLQDCTRVAIFWAGVFGLVLYFASSVLWLLGDRAPRFTDSIDWGPWTGVSTLLVLLMYVHTFAVRAGLVGFNAYRGVTRTARSA